LVCSTYRVFVVPQSRLFVGDDLPKAVGHGMKQLARRTPTVSNLAWTELLFWDGRAEGLEAQALGPIESPDEMDQKIDALLVKLSNIQGYRNLFEKAYPGEGITPKTIAKALAAFQRTLVSGPAPFDQWVAGNDDAISENAKNGFLLFNTKGKCFVCHGGWNFTDQAFTTSACHLPISAAEKFPPN
jgi:cytochrome c peroxidase